MVPCCRMWTNMSLLMDVERIKEGLCIPACVFCRDVSQPHALYALHDIIDLPWHVVYDRLCICICDSPDELVKWHCGINLLHPNLV